MEYYYCLAPKERDSGEYKIGLCPAGGWSTRTVRCAANYQQEHSDVLTVIYYYHECPCC